MGPIVPPLIAGLVAYDVVHCVVADRIVDTAGVFMPDGVSPFSWALSLADSLITTFVSQLGICHESDCVAGPRKVESYSHVLHAAFAVNLLFGAVAFFSRTGFSRLDQLQKRIREWILEPAVMQSGDQELEPPLTEQEVKAQMVPFGLAARSLLRATTWFSFVVFGGCATLSLVLLIVAAKYPEALLSVKHQFLIEWLFAAPLLAIGTLWLIPFFANSSQFLFPNALRKRWRIRRRLLGQRVADWVKLRGIRPRLGRLLVTWAVRVDPALESDLKRLEDINRT